MIASASKGNDYSLPSVSKGALEKWLVVLGLLVGSALLLISPLAKPIWTDELDSLKQGIKPFLTVIAGASDTQPPLHFLVLRICYALFGNNLAVFRLASALPSCVALWYVYLIGRRISPGAGLLALWLTALSPALILFDRMMRYHGLLALLATMCVYYGLRVLEQGRRRDAVKYGVVAFLMFMTYYLSLFVVFAQIVVLLLHWRQEPYRRLFLGALAAAVAAFLPWFIHGLLFAQHNVALPDVEDASMSLGVGGFIRRVVFPVYDYCLGETIYPWVWPVSVAGVISVLAAFGAGGRRLWGKRDFVLPLTCLFVVLLSALATSGKLGAGQTVGSMGKRVAFALPLFYVVLSAGILSVRTQFMRVIWAALILLISFYAIRNYWADKQFLNPNYIARWDQAIAIMQRTHMGDDTLVASSSDPALHYYLDRTPHAVHHVNSADWPQVKQALAASHARYLWVMGRDRGDRNAVSSTMALNDTLAAKYAQIGWFGIMPRSDRERYWMQKVLKRPASPYYIWLELIDTSRPSAGLK